MGEILTFGCRLNAHESDTLAHLARGEGNAVIVNTCAVTATAERQARQAIRRAHRADPQAPVIVTGCASERDPASWLSLPGVTRIVPNARKLDPSSWPSIRGAPRAEPPPSRHARALLQVQNGCDHRCTFCVIPQGRGPSRSASLAESVSRARALAQAGHREIVLTGVDIASWQDGGGEGLGTLCREILRAVPEIARLRLSSLDPVLLHPEHGDRDLWRLLEDESRLAPHLHLSLQAGSDLILKRMKRRHDTASVARALDRARALRPGIAVGADLIAGFPTETDALFEETLAFVTAQAIPFLHVFPYSERPGTPAARMPAVPNATRQERARRLREAGEKTRAAFLDGLTGTVLDVLIETPGYGHSAQFAPVRMNPVRLEEGQTSPPRGSLVALRILSRDGDTLIGETAAP